MYNVRLVSKFDDDSFKNVLGVSKIDVILKGEMLIMFPTHITHTQLMLRACLIVCRFVILSLLIYVIELRSRIFFNNKR